MLNPLYKDRGNAIGNHIKTVAENCWVAKYFNDIFFDVASINRDSVVGREFNATENTVIFTVQLFHPHAQTYTRIHTHTRIYIICTFVPFPFS